MDDRVARALLEDNILVRQKRAEADIALLQKLATNPSVVLEELPIPGETEPPASNALHWQNVFLFDEFVSPIGFLADPSGVMIGNLGWDVGGDTSFVIVAMIDQVHYGIAVFTNSVNTTGVINLNGIISEAFSFVQIIAACESMLDAGDGCILGLVESVSFSIDGSTNGIYFRREYTEANWHAVTTDGIGTTDTDTGVPFIADTFFVFDIKYSSGAIKFYINQVLVATHTTNIYTADIMRPLIGMQDPGSTSAFNIKVDYFAMQLAPMIQRWD